MLKVFVAVAIIFSIAFTRTEALPYYGDNFDDDAEFVPLEQQQHQHGRNDGPRPKAKPFEVDVITSEIGGNNPIGHSPGLFFQQSFPFFGHDIFNSFGGFGFGAGPAQEPWWKGPNVCTEKEEDVKDMKAAQKDGEEVIEEEQTAAGSETTEIRPPFFGGHIHLSVNSCVEKPNKYVCSRIVNENGRKKTLTISRQCCHGYGRARNAEYTTPCEKIEIKNIEEAAKDIDTAEFLNIGKSQGLSDVLSNRRNVTIFMPVDKAYNHYKDDVQNENNFVESKEEGGIRNLYLRHIVPGEISLDEVSNDDILKTDLEGQTIRINTYQMPLPLSKEPYRITANCIPIEKHDKLTENGMIHSLDGVLKPVHNNVMDIIRQRKDLSIIRTVLENTKLSEMLEANKPVTIFVPTDSAFDKVDPHLRRALKEGKGCATNLLKNHILDLTFCSVASVAGAKTTAYNLLGEALRFNRSKISTAKSEVADLLDEQQQPVVINGIAKILETDIMGTNGVMHVIDTILPTQSAFPLSTLLQEKNVTIFKQLIEAAGLDNAFNDLDNVTVFTPTDKALQNTKWAQLLKESPEKLSNNNELIEFLNYHVIAPMTKTCDLTEKMLPTKADGRKVRINLYSTHALFTNVMNRATVNCARLIHFDDESCGAIVHQIDKPLAPPKQSLLELLESNPDYSKFLNLVRSANLTNLLNNVEESYTLLVPKNEVFAEFEDPDDLENLIKTHIVNDVVCCAGIIPVNWPFVRTIESLNGAHLHITRERRPKIENAGVTKCDSVAVNGIIHEINDIIVPSRRQQKPQQTFTPNFGDTFF